MQFEKAYKELVKGKKIRRKEWEYFMHLRLIDGKVKTYKGEYTQFYKDSSIITSGGWIVIDGENDKHITFIEALEELKNKKKLTNIDWIEAKEDKFIFVDQNQIAMCKAIEFDFMPTYMCFLATDWEVMT